MFQTPAGFEDMQPANVKKAPFQSAAMDRGARGGGCYSKVDGWQRTDIDYKGGDCLGKACFELPTFKRDLAVALAYSRRIPACGISLPTATPEPTQSPAPNATPVPGNPGNGPVVPPRNDGGGGNPPGNNGGPQNPPPNNGPGNGNGNNNGGGPRN
jgi:hypothetical protein